MSTRGGDGEWKFWYDGFTFGKVTDIHNPWSATFCKEASPQSAS